MSDRPTDRLGFLDALRAIGASAVVAEHVLVSWVPGFFDLARRYFDLGQFGVTLFLLVSGFIIPMTLERGGSNARFWGNRFFRLFPLYWAILAACALHYALAQPATLHGPTLREWLVNLTMLQAFVGVPHVLGVFWTLTLELVFYAACSLLFALGFLRRTERLVWLGMAGLFLAGVVLPLVLRRHLPGGWAFLILTMFVGTAFHRCSVGELAGRRLALLLVSLALLAVPLAYVGFEMFRREEMQYTCPCMLAVWGGAYGVFIVAYCLRARTPPGWLRYLGRISYSIYLVHALELLVLPSDWPALAYLPTFLVSTLLVSALTYRFIEQPAVAFGRRLLTAREPAIPMRRAA